MTSKKRILSHPAVKEMTASHMQSFDYLTYEVQLNEGFEYMECSFFCEETYKAIWEELKLVKFVGVDKPVASLCSVLDRYGMG